MNIRPETEEEVCELSGRLVKIGDYIGAVNDVFSYSPNGPNTAHYSVCSQTSCRDVYLGTEIELLPPSFKYQPEFIIKVVTKK